MSELELSHVIEKLRHQMIRLAAEKGSLTDENVVVVSQQLDIFLLKFQYLKRLKHTKFRKVI